MRDLLCIEAGALSSPDASTRPTLGSGPTEGPHRFHNSTASHQDNNSTAGRQVPPVRSRSVRRRQFFDVVDDKSLDLLFTRIEPETELLDGLKQGASAGIGWDADRGGRSTHAQGSRHVLHVLLRDIESDLVVAGQA